MFFTVKQPMKLNGKICKPCICYEASKEMEKPLKELADKGKVNLFEKRVFFQNGKLLPSLKEREDKIKAEKKAKKESEKKAKKEEVTVE